MHIRVVYETSLSLCPENQEHHDHSGQEVQATPLDPTLYDPGEVGPMFKIIASDGWTGHAFEDELTFEGDGTDVD